MKRIIYPILSYMSFSKDSGDGVTVSSDKFKRDLQTLIDNCYSSVSLTDLNSCSEHEKAFCVILYGGYSNHYDIAFPILTELNIQADAFIPTELVGRTDYPGIDKFVPHFSWEEASEMHRSGLINIYGLWHPFDEGKDMVEEVRSKAETIRANISGCNDQSFFLFPSSMRSEDVLPVLKNAGMTGYLSYYYNTNATDLKAGALPFIEVNQESNIIDLIDMFRYRCYSALKREESVFRPLDETTLNWEYAGESVILPIDDDPPARNLLRHAIPLSIIGATRKDKAEMIIMNNYIDVVFRPWYHFFDYDNHLYLSWPELICNRITVDYFRELNISIADCVIGGLKTGYYSDLWLDAYYIPGKSMYQRTHLAHNVLVYGYNSDGNEFLAISYTESGHYDRLKIKPENLIRSCSNDYFISIQLMKNNPEAMVDYNDALITEKLKRYIESRYEPANNTKDSRYDNNQLCNYNACLAFPEYLKSTANKEGRIYTVALYGFLEHKRLMGRRLEFMARMRGQDENEYSRYRSYSEEIAERLKMLGMKYQYTQNTGIIDRMVEMMNELLEKEKDAVLGIIYGKQQRKRNKDISV